MLEKGSCYIGRSVSVSRKGAPVWRLGIAIISLSPLRPNKKPLLITLDEKGFKRSYPPLISPRPLALRYHSRAVLPGQELAPRCVRSGVAVAS